MKDDQRPGAAPFTRPGEMPTEDELAKARRRAQAKAKRADPDPPPEDADPFEAALDQALNKNARTLAQLIAQGDPPPRKWLIEDLLPANETVMLVGQGASGKGHLLQYLALRMVAGPEFAGFHIPRPIKTLWISLEDSMDELWRRAVAAVKERGEVGHSATPWRDYLDNITFVDLRGITMTGAAIDDARFTKAVAAHAIAMKADLVVLDPIGRMLGGLDINSQKDASRLHNAADHIGKTANATVLLTHHVNKGGMRSSNAKDDAETGARATSGSHLLVDLARCVLRIVPYSKAEARKKWDLDQAALELTMPKPNFAPPMDDPIVFTRQAGGALRWESGAQENKRDETQLLEALAEYPEGLDRTEWQKVASDIGMGKPRYEKAKNALLDDGRVVKTQKQVVAGKAKRDWFLVAGQP